MKLNLSLFLGGLLLASAHDVRVGNERDSHGDARNHHNGGLRASGHDPRVREGDVVSHTERSHDHRNHDTGMGDRASGGYDSRVYEGDAVVSHNERSHDRYHDTSIGERGSHGDFDQRGNGNNGNGNGGNGNNGNGNGNGGGGGNGNAKPPAYGRNKIKTKNCNNNSNAPHCDVDLELSLGADEDLEFTLPNGKTITFKKTPGGNGRGKAWSGESPSGGRANIIDRVDKSANEDRFFGSFVDTEDGDWNICQMRPDYAGNHVIDCKPGADFHDEPDPIRRHLMENGEVQEIIRDAPSAHEGRNLQSTSVIDMMVLWTLDAECLQSGLSAGCTTTATTESNIRGLIDLAIAETNTAFTNSGIFAEVRLVHAYRANYQETSFSTSLDDLKNGIEHSNTLRSEYGADAVALIVGSINEYCGLGYLGPSSGWMYSVTYYDCATGYYTFGHELGHNLGCNHDRGASSACTSSASNYGYRDPNANYRTIMAYSCVSGQCDNNPGGNCPKVQMFSTPVLQTQDGNVAGTEFANNAGQINSIAATVAAYYTAPSPPTPAPTLPPTPPPTTPPVTNTPTPPPAPPPTPAPVPTSNCVDVEGWHDSDGPPFTCDWYAANAPWSCNNYGDSYTGIQNPGEGGKIRVKS